MPSKRLLSALSFYKFISGMYRDYSSLPTLISDLYEWPYPCESLCRKG